jgi:hypothetical protein
LVSEGEESVENFEGGTCSGAVVSRWKPSHPQQLLLRGPRPQPLFAVARVYRDLVDAVGVQDNDTRVERFSARTAVADAMSELNA